MSRPPEVSVRAVDSGERRLPLKPCTTIGRAEDSDIYFPDQLLSRRHAQIQVRPGGCFLMDLGSTNGTFLNGTRVNKERPLIDGDLITVGENRILYHASGAADAEADDGLSLHGRSTRKTIAVTEMVRENRVLGILAQVTTSLLVQKTVPELLSKILEMVFEHLPAERGAVLLLHGDPPTPVLTASRTRVGSDPIAMVSKSITRRVIDGRVALLLRDVHEDKLLRGQPSIISEAIRSAACAPLWLSAGPGMPDKVLGLVYFDSRSELHPFDESDLQILTVLANIAATKLESARLTEENQEKLRLQDDMHAAAKIQARLLPNVAPRVSGYDLVGITRSSRTVGGDYYDFMWEDNRLYLALGDVSGKGLGAAMLMVALRATVRTHWRTGRLGEATTRMNTTFHENVPDDQYATIFLARLEPKEGRLTYVNAGHNRPLLVRAGQTDCEALSDAGMILGAFESVTYEESVVGIAPGDVLLIFSDGVSETWSDPDDADRRLIQIVRDNRHLGAHAIQAAIFDELYKLSGSRPGDDRTIVVVKRDAAIPRPA